MREGFWTLLKYLKPLQSCWVCSNYAAHAWTVFISISPFRTFDDVPSVILTQRANNLVPITHRLKLTWDPVAQWNNRVPASCRVWLKVHMPKSPWPKVLHMTFIVSTDICPKQYRAHAGKYTHATVSYMDRIQEKQKTPIYVDIMCICT